jgi:drug/metabolite transporter (DMT)-like permease
MADMLTAGSRAPAGDAFGTTREAPKRPGLGMLLAAAAAICWGSATVISKAILAEVDPAVLLALQVGGSVAALWIVVLARGTPSSPWRTVRGFAWLGLLEPTLAYALLLGGLIDTGAGRATLIGATEPMLIVGFSALILGLRPSARLVLLSVGALAGLAVALGVATPGARTLGRPELLVLAGTAVAALFATLSGRIATAADPIYITAWQQTVGLGAALVLLTARWLSASHALALPHGVAAWGTVALSGVVLYALPFPLYLAALRHLDTNRTGAFLIAVPLAGIAGSVVFLGEHLALSQWAGTALTLALLALINLEKPEPLPAASHRSS